MPFLLDDVDYYADFLHYARFSLIFCRSFRFSAFASPALLLLALMFFLHFFISPLFRRDAADADTLSYARFLLLLPYAAYSDFSFR